MFDLHAAKTMGLFRQSVSFHFVTPHPPPRPHLFMLSVINLFKLFFFESAERHFNYRYFSLFVQCVCVCAWARLRIVWFCALQILIIWCGYHTWFYWKCSPLFCVCVCVWERERGSQNQCWGFSASVGNTVVYRMMITKTKTRRV